MQVIFTSLASIRCLNCIFNIHTKDFRIDDLTPPIISHCCIFYSGYSSFAYCYHLTSLLLQDLSFSSELLAQMVLYHDR